MVIHVSVVVSVRLPEALLRDIKKTVELGHYTSLNEFFVSGVRRELYRHIEPPVAREVREAREEMTREFFEMAGGDWDKAAELEAKHIAETSAKLKRIRPEYF
ncbi:MAG: hypothetical protein KAW41_02805 [Candidatus Diapherotrites archaeon]|nr:hypothetical protein [Candidatus Diapherotrites archaeon]